MSRSGPVLFAAALLAAPACHHHARPDPKVRDAFALCAPGAPIEACQRALNHAGVLCERDARAGSPGAPIAYRCTMPGGRWDHITVLSSPSDHAHIVHLALDSTHSSKADYDAAARAMAAACGGVGKAFNLSPVTGVNWMAHGETGPADGQATVSLADDALTLEEAWTASLDFGPFTSWLQGCERGTVQHGLM